MESPTVKTAVTRKIAQQKHRPVIHIHSLSVARALVYHWTGFVTRSPTVLVGKTRVKSDVVSMNA